MGREGYKGGNERGLGAYLVYGARVPSYATAEQESRSIAKKTARCALYGCPPEIVNGLLL